MRVVASPQESAELVASHQPAIVIASSGMATGGRVLSHLAAGLPDSKNTVLFVGHQAEGTRGRQPCDGAKQLKLQGQVVPVAARVERIDRCRRTPTPARSCVGCRTFRTRPP